MNFFLKKALPISNMIMIIIIIIFDINCSILKYHMQKNLDVEQGIYLTTQDMKKINVSMHKDEILSNIGPPILKDIFGENIWYYTYYHHFSNGQEKYQTIELIFDSNDFLTTMNCLQ